MDRILFSPGGASILGTVLLQPLLADLNFLHVSVVDVLQRRGGVGSESELVFPQWISHRGTILGGAYPRRVEFVPGEPLLIFPLSRQSFPLQVVHLNRLLSPGIPILGCDFPVVVKDQVLGGLFRGADFIANFSMAARLREKRLASRKDWVTILNQTEASRQTCHTTGLTKAQIEDLCTRIEARELKPGMRRWPPIPGLRGSLTVTLKYLRRNRVQEEIAEDYGVSQPTISRAISAITPVLVQALLDYVPTADDLDGGWQFIVDGTLLPCWSWAAHPDLYSGKHKTTGMKVLVACTLDGRLSWVSGPVPGKRHDNYWLGESGILLDADPRNWIGDKGFAGNGMITPFKKPAGGELLDWQKEFNTQVSKIRYVIEQVIAHFKNWRIMHTDYRRPIETFATTISAVIGLHFYRMA